jgi:hypothetical protein
MLVDVHSHLFHYPEHFSKDFVTQVRRARSGVEIDLTVRWEEYHAHAKQCDKENGVLMPAERIHGPTCRDVTCR